MKRFIQLYAVLCAAAIPLLAQGSAVNLTLGPPPSAWLTLFYRDGSGNTQYICYSPALAPTTTYAIGSTPALTSVVVATNVGTINFGATAQLWVGQTVTIAGSTTSALNGTYRLNTVSGSTATIATSGVADATYNNAAMTVSTNGPLLDALRWSIQVFTYTSTSVNATYFAGAPSVGIPQNLACSNRANY